MKGASEQFVEQACALLDNASSPLTTQELSSLLQVSSSHCVRQFKAVLGISPKQYASQIRAQQFRRRLDRGQDILSSALDSGFQSLSQAYELSPDILGMTPRARQQQTPPPIHVAIAKTTLGTLLVAQTDKGVCDIIGSVRVACWFFNPHVQTPMVGWQPPHPGQLTLP